MKKISLVVFQATYTLALYLLAAFLMGIALYPSLWFVYQAWVNVADLGIDIQLLTLSTALGLGYFLFGFVLTLLVGCLRTALMLRLHEGEFGVASLETIQWTFLNALFFLVRTLFMDFLLLTPFCVLFYRLMGAKIGHNVQINSKNVADTPLLEIGDNSVIGGNATVIAHSFERKGMVLKKVKIGRNVVIGLNAVVLPGVEIGDGAVVAAGVIVPKNTIIKPKTTYFGKNKDD